MGSRRVARDGGWIHGGPELAYCLAFVPLASELVDLVIPPATGGSREVHGLRKILSSPWLIDQLTSLPGYDPSHCGERFA